MRGNYGYPYGPKYSSETKAVQGSQLLPLQGQGWPILRPPQGKAPAIPGCWVAEVLALGVPGPSPRELTGNQCNQMP